MSIPTFILRFPTTISFVFDAFNDTLFTLKHVYNVSIIIIIINKFICNSTELDSHIQYIQAYKILGNTNATLRDTQRDTYTESLVIRFLH